MIYCAVNGKLDARALQHYSNMTGDEASAPQPEEAQQQPPGPRPADHEHTGALEVGAAVEMAEAAPGEAEEPPAGSRGVQQGGDDQGGDQQDAGPPPPPSTAAGAGAAELSDAGRPDEPAAPKELVAPKEEEEEFSEGRRLPAPADGAPAAAVAAQPAVQQQPAPAAPNLGNGAVQQPQEQQGLPAALASAFLHAAQHLQQQKHEPQPAPSAPRPSPPSAAEPEQRLTGMPGGEELHVSAGGGPPSLPSQQQPEGQALPRPVSSTGAGSSGKVGGGARVVEQWGLHVVYAALACCAVPVLRANGNSIIWAWLQKCVECGSMDTPMWRTHPVHGARERAVCVCVCVCGGSEVPIRPQDSCFAATCDLQ